MTKTHFTVLSLILSFVALTGALVAEYGFGLLPCPLCIYQRIPYILIIVLSLYALIVKQGARNVSLLVLYAIILLFAADALIAFYHVGIEQGLFAELEGCGGEAVPTTLEEIEKQIASAQAISCGTPAFVFLGLSMAAWNMLYATACAFFLSRKIRNIQ